MIQRNSVMKLEDQLNYLKRIRKLGCKSKEQKETVNINRLCNA